MARQTKIGLYGSYRSTGPDESALIRAKALSDAAQGIAGAVQEDSQDKFKQELVSQRNDILNDSILKMDEIQRSHEYDEEGFTAITNGWIKGKVENVPNALKDMVRADLEASRNKRSIQIRDAVEKRDFSVNSANFKTDLNSIRTEGVEAIRTGEPDDAAIKELSFFESVQEGVEAGYLTPEQAANATKSFEQRKKNAKFMRMVDEIVQDPELTEDEQIQRTESLIQEIKDGEFKDITGEEKDSILTKMGVQLNRMYTNKNRNQAERSMEASEMLYGLQMTASKGPEGLEYETFSDEVDEAYYGGVFGDPTSKEAIGMRSGLKKQAENSRKKITDAQQREIDGWAGILKSLNGAKGLPHNPKHIDSFWEKAFAPELENQPQSEWAGLTADFVEKTRMVPSQVKNRMIAQINSGDIEQVRMAKDIYSRLDSVAGMNGRVLDAKNEIYMDSIIRLADYMPEEEAIAEANRLRNKRNEDYVTGKSEAIKELEKDNADMYTEGAQDALESVFGKELDENSYALFDATADYKALFRHYVMNNATEEDAHRLAGEKISKTWSESEFGFMPNAPERFYQMSGQEIRDDLYGELRENIFGLEFKKEDVYLMSDDITQRQAGSGQPSYAIMYRDENGVWQYHDKRYIPDAKKAYEERLSAQELQFKQSKEAALKAQNSTALQGIKPAGAIM